MNNTWLIIGALLLAGLALYFCVWNKKGAPKEAYSNIGAIDNLGSLDSSYELLPAPEELVPASHFADLVDTGDHIDILQHPQGDLDAIRPLERLERLSTQRMLPSTAKSVTPYAVDVADISTYSFSVNAPRVSIKSRVWNQSDPYRGDIPITYHPDIATIGKSQFGRDSWRGDGYFSDFSAQLFNRYTSRGYKNLPLQTAVQGTILS